MWFQRLPLEIQCRLGRISDGFESKQANDLNKLYNKGKNIFYSCSQVLDTIFLGIFSHTNYFMQHVFRYIWVRISVWIEEQHSLFLNLFRLRNPVYSNR